jgi:hypothetical protein
MFAGRVDPLDSILLHGLCACRHSVFGSRQFGVNQFERHGELRFDAFLVTFTDSQIGRRYMRCCTSKSCFLSRGKRLNPVVCGRSKPLVPKYAERHVGSHRRHLECTSPYIWTR